MGGVACCAVADGTSVEQIAKPDLTGEFGFRQEGNGKTGNDKMDVKPWPEEYCVDQAPSQKDADVNIDQIASLKAKARLLFISDPGQDLDDEMTFIMLRYLVEMDLVEVKGIVTTLYPSFDRARLCKGTLDALGLFGVPVGVGSDGGDTKGQHKKSTFEDWAKQYMIHEFSQSAAAFLPGRQLLHSVYSKAEPSSITLVIIASLKDPAIFLRDCEELFLEKTREVVIMGGVEAWDGNSENCVLKPDTAHNQQFDKAASAFFYQRCQEIGVRLVIVSRWAAYATKVPRSCYDELASLGSWVGCRLRNAQRASIESLWGRACAEGEARHGLPDRCDRAWFLKTFCGGATAEARDEQCTIWDLVEGFMQYDTVAALAAIPELREQYFDPYKVSGLHNVEHLVIGKSETQHCISDPGGFATLLDNGFKTGLALNHSRKIQMIICCQPMWGKRIEDLLAVVAIRAVYELGFFELAGIIMTAAPGVESGSELQLPKLSAMVKILLSELGMSHVPVLCEKTIKSPTKRDGAAIGTSNRTSCTPGKFPSSIRTNTSNAVLSGAAGSAVNELDVQERTGVEYLRTLYENVSPAGVVIVCTGCLGDISVFAEEYPKMFCEKTQKVIIIGGAKVERNHAVNDENVLTPDGDATNNKLDMPGAVSAFSVLQEKLVPIVVVSRHAFGSVQLPRTFFDLLASHGGKIGQKLYEAQSSCIEELWKAACSTNKIMRGRLPDRCDKDWFINSFCTKEPEADTGVWPCINVFSVYNLVAILMALPPVMNKFAQATRVEVRGVKHQLLGESTDSVGIIDPDEFRKLMCQLIFTGTKLNTSVYDLKPPPAININVKQGQKELLWQHDEDNHAIDWMMPANDISIKRLCSRWN